MLSVSGKNRLLPTHYKLRIKNRQIWQENTLNFLSFFCALKIIYLVLDSRVWGWGTKLEKFHFAVEARSHKNILSRMKIDTTNDRLVFVAVVGIYHLLEI